MSQVGAIRDGAVEDRIFQVNIANTCLKAPTLVVLPTGLGKTIVALLVISRIVGKGGRALFLAPTRPLVEQHRSFLESKMENVEILAMSGEVPPKVRGASWGAGNVTVSTPQVVQNDVTMGRCDLGQFSLVIYDEAHRALGSYPYVFVASRHRRARIGIGLPYNSMGMTASPGSHSGRILNICRNLGLERAEIRSRSDIDVRPYVHDTVTRWRMVGMPLGTRSVTRPLEELLDGYIKELQNAHLIKRGPRVNVTDLLRAREKASSNISLMRARGDRWAQEAVQKLIRFSKVTAKALTLSHAIELAQTQGPGPLRRYMERLVHKGREGTSSAFTKEILLEPLMQCAIEEASEVEGLHPKVELLKEIVKEQLGRGPGSNIIIFSNYRDSSNVIYNELLGMENVRPCRFVGRSSSSMDKGMTQKDQARMVQDFKAGAYNVMIATSVAEEGLDIPATDLVVFYEPVASEIRAIQRRGRTGRTRPGRVEILMTKGTKDEAAYWSSRSKEQKMRKRLDDLRRDLGTRMDIGRPETAEPLPKMSLGSNHSRTTNDQNPRDRYQDGRSGSADSWDHQDAGSRPNKDRETLMNMSRPHPTKAKGLSFDAPVLSGPLKTSGSKQVSIVIDHREMGSRVSFELSNMDIELEPRQLEIGDFILSDRVCVERKVSKDLATSLVDGRLFRQLGAMGACYKRPILLIEGGDFTGGRNISAKAMQGALISIAVDLGIPILRTPDSTATAALLVALAEREASEPRPSPTRKDRPGMGPESRLHHIVEGLPGTSAIISRRLLAHFGTVRCIMNASMEQLMEVQGIGRGRAESIFEIVRTKADASREYPR